MPDHARPAYRELLEFLTSQPTLEQIVNYTPSDHAVDRLRYLIHVSRERVLNVDERFELDEYTRMDHFMQMLKRRARRRLT
jgi:hypothetical protein